MTHPLSENTWLQYWQRKPTAKIRLFCFPYAGGGAAIFRNWSKQLPPEVEVCPVQLPGREHRLREAAFSQIAPLIDSVMDGLHPYLDMPYALFGHSMGALVSFELARRLYRTEHRSKLLHLFVSGHRAPQIPDPNPPTYHLPEEEFIEELRNLNGTPEEVLQNQELLSLLLPLLRSDFALCETYIYVDDAPLHCPVTAYGGLQDREASQSDLARWKELTDSSFYLRRFPGDHFFLHAQQSLLLQSLIQDLKRS